MKTLVSVLVESPFYFTMPLGDRYDLVRRLLQGEKEMDLSAMQLKLDTFLNIKPGRRD
jgi:hypothetical protein